MDLLELVADGRPAENGRIGVSPTHQHVATKNRLPDLEGARGLFEVFSASATRRPDSNCLGYRPRNADGTVGPYAWISYGEALKQAADLGAALHATGLQKGGRCSIFAQNSPQWMVAMQVRAVPLALAVSHSWLGRSSCSALLLAAHFGLSWSRQPGRYAGMQQAGRVLRPTV